MSLNVTNSLSVVNKRNNCSQTSWDSSKYLDLNKKGSQSNFKYSRWLCFKLVAKDIIGFD